MADYHKGLLSCFDDFGLCVDVFICFPCQMGRQYTAAVDGSTNTFNFLCCIASFFLPECIACHVRSTITAKYNLQESCICGFAKSFLCTPCSACQTHAELTHRNVWPGGTCCHSAPNAPMH